MQNLSPAEQLDFVLKFIGQKDDHSGQSRYFYKAFNTIYGHISDSKVGIEMSEAMMILDKLIKDGYIRENLINAIGDVKPKPRYHITFEGRLLIESGGYCQKAILDASENMRLTALEISQHELGRKLNVLTGWIAGATILLALIELTKMASDYHWIHLAK